MRRVLSVVVVTHNSVPLLPTMVASLPSGLSGLDDFEVIVVDSGSADGTLEQAGRLLPRARLVDLAANLGYAAGINAGIAASQLGGPVLVLNPDIAAREGAFTRLVDALGSEDAGITVPRLVDEHGATQWSLRRRPSVTRALAEALFGGRAGRFPPLGEVVRDPATYDHAATVDWATGAAMCISRECCDDVGAWDEGFFLYSEETDFSLRAADAGYRTRYEPAAVVLHVGGEAMVSDRLFSLLCVNRVRSFQKRHGRVATEAFRAALATGLAIRGTSSARHRAALHALFGSPVAVVRRAGRPDS